MPPQRGRRRPSEPARILARASVDLRDRLHWSQRRLAVKADVSQAAVWRLETGQGDKLDLGVVVGVMRALGGEVQLSVRAPMIAEGRRQLDPAHARMIGYIGRRLRGDGWEVHQEVEVRSGRAIGWIDILAFRPADRACLMGEAKTELLDLGGAQRQVQWYTREAWAAAGAAGWRPATITPALLVLDTRANAEVIAANSRLLRDAFPKRSPELIAGVKGTGAMPTTAAIAMVDPLSRRVQWLRPTITDGRRSPPPYENYASFMGEIDRRRFRRRRSG